MIYSIILFVLFSFFSYRLIGINASIIKGFISSVFSLIFSSIAFYALHLNNPTAQNALIQLDHYSFLYFITLIIVSMGFSLLLEMMDVKNQRLEVDRVVNTRDRIRYFVSTRLRYLNLLINVTKNGLLRSTLQLDREERNEQVTIAFKNTLEKAGGIFVKFGQFLSTRSDLFPKSFRNELATLQEKVTPVPVEQIKEIIYEQFNQPAEQVFEYFDDKPLAAASMAQVHKARLNSGEKVIVKVLRPSLRKQLTIDINILANFSELLSNKAAWARRVGIVNLTEGFIRNLYEEVDFSIELRNMQELKRQGGTNVYIPKAFESYSTSEVLVMEYLNGVSINNINERITDRKKIQEINHTIFQEMLTQIFDNGLFHGDPHPGNIFLLHNKQAAFIDFGSVGRLSTKQKNGFKWLLIGMNRENADSMIHGIKGLVENSEEINDKQLEQALSQFLAEHNFDGNIMDDMGKELFDMMSHFGLRFFPDVAGAFRSLITLQGSLQSIDPNFNLTVMIEVYLKNQMNIEKLTETAFENMEDDVLNLIPRIRALPSRVDNIVQQAESGKITFKMSLFGDEDNVRFVNSVLSLFFTGLTGIALGLLALGALFLAQTEDPDGYSFLNVFGYSGLGISVTMLIRVVIHSLNRRQ